MQDNITYVFSSPGGDEGGGVSGTVMSVPPPSLSFVFSCLVLLLAPSLLLGPSLLVGFVLENSHVNAMTDTVEDHTS